MTVDYLLTLFPDFPLQFIDHLRRYVSGDDPRLSEAEFNRVTEKVSDFTRAVLRTTMTIECGETLSYRELAERMGRPEAVRAVASALGRNPLPVIIPCHRVVATNNLGGYHFGTEVKKMLLLFEGMSEPYFASTEDVKAMRKV